MDILKEKYSITELGEMLQLTDHTLRFYEKEFDLPVPKDDRGRRYYTAELANIMYKIKVMRSEGLEIKAIKKILHQDFAFESPRVLHEANGTSLAVAGIKENEAVQAVFQEFGRQLAREISFEMETVRDYLSREISKSKLELGACVENGFRRLEGKMEKHYEEVDRALGRWREKTKRRPLIRLISGLFKHNGTIP